MEKIPLLFLGDPPAGNSGLGRILRDVATQTHEKMGDVFDVGVIGGTARENRLPFKQYPMLNVKDWMVQDLPYAWQAHVGNREGILFPIWDVSRLLWMAFPNQCPDPHLKNFLLNFNGKKWIYPAVDGSGPSGKLPHILADALTKFDRVLNYTKFSAEITGYPDVCWHGIDTKVFYPRYGSRRVIDEKFKIGLSPEELFIGIVATNQPRKDWALAFGALALLNRQGIKTRVWIHTDTDMRHWDLKSLYIDCGLSPNVNLILTPYGIPDELIAELYSACDLTLGIGPEGFGYPIAESLCCGTPCVTGSYGGQSDFVPEQWQVEPVAYRQEGIFGIVRPVYSPVNFADKIMDVYRGVPGDHGVASPVCCWDCVWPKWEEWLRKGL